jgi:serine/threonine protein phosphatase PrpC
MPFWNKKKDENTDTDDLTGVQGTEATQPLPQDRDPRDLGPVNEGDSRLGGQEPGQAEGSNPGDEWQRNGPSQFGQQGPPPPMGYQGLSVRTDYHHQQAVPDGPAQWSAPPPVVSPESGDTRTENAAGRHAMPPGIDTRSPMPPAGRPAGAAPDFDEHTPAHSDPAWRTGAGAAPGAGVERPVISLPGQAGSQDQDVAETRAFPEPLVIGEMPTLRSDPRGLPRPDPVPDPVVPDTALDGVDFEGLLIRGASLRGDGHRYAATVRQDSMGMWRVGGSASAAVLVCAADGVSSEPLSHRGAAAACGLLRDAIALDVQDLLKTGAKRLVKQTWEEVAHEVCKRLTAIAGCLGVAPRALSTTLAAALVELSPPDPAQRRFVILNVGDATAFLLKDGTFSELLVDPHATTITSTATYALPTSIGEVGVDIGVIGPGDMLMVCTDGMSNPMRNDEVRAQLAQWWGNGQVPSMPEFGWQMSYRVKTYDDDRTAVCVWGR